jgi:hypothetical protein
VTFALKPDLARSEWLKFIERQVPTTDLVPEAPLAGLGPDSTTSGRWSALIAFVERWYGKPVDQAAIVVQTKLGPPLVRKMIGLHAAVPEVMQHNHLVQPDELELEEGKVVFLVENQAVCLWATEPAGEDPIVWYRNNVQGEPWIEEPERLSGFLIQAVLFEAILHARFGASGTALPGETVRAILAQVAPLGNGRLNWGGARFFACDGALVMIMGDDGASDVWLAARTPLALSRFEGLADDRWDHVAF